MRFNRFVIVMLVLFASLPAGSTKTNLYTTFKNMPLADAITFLATFSHKTVIVDGDIAGRVSLSVSEAPTESLFDAFLAANQLSKQVVGNTWYVIPTRKLLKQQETAAKLQGLAESVEPLQVLCWPVKYASATNIESMLHAKQSGFLSQRGYVYADKRTNLLCIKDTDFRLNAIKRVLQQLDVPVQQIMIDARVVSMDRDSEKALGLVFAMHGEVGADKSNLVAPLLAPYRLALAKLNSQSLLDIRLAALEAKGKAELISRPKLFTANQQEATIAAGEEIPYQETSQGGGTAAVFKKAVLGLKVTPQVLPQGKVRLQIELRQDRPSQRLVHGVPTIQTRQLTTNVLVEEGRTIVLGGIYESSRDQGQKRTPFLSDLPLVGGLFTFHRQVESKRELLVFVTPHVMIDNYEK